jgi:hypothetical protein
VTRRDFILEHIAEILPACSGPTQTILGRNRLIWAAKRSNRVLAASPTTLKRRGYFRTTSMVWVPMEPVEPRMIMFFNLGKL